MTGQESVFWLSGGFVFYTYLGYPAILYALGVLAPKPIRRAYIEPSVTLVIAAFNEEAAIVSKIENSKSLDYPRSKLTIVVASDGSTDRTVELASAWCDDQVQLIAFPANRGKLAVLNEVVAKLSTEVVVFSDATTAIAKESLRQLLSNLADPDVGGVSGSFEISHGEAGQLGGQDRLYWKYESKIKQLESKLGSTLGAHGALYAIRRDLYSFPPLGSINDDYLIPVDIVIGGSRFVYDASAQSSESDLDNAGFARRIRIARGNWMQLGRIPVLLRKGLWLESWIFISHKGCRLLVAVAMLSAFVSNALLYTSFFYRFSLWTQLAFYMLAALGLVAPLRPRVLRIPYYFCMVHAPAAVAAWQWLTGQKHVTWKSG